MVTKLMQNTEEPLWNHCTSLAQEVSLKKDYAWQYNVMNEIFDSLFNAVYINSLDKSRSYSI